MTPSHPPETDPIVPITEQKIEEYITKLEVIRERRLRMVREHEATQERLAHNEKMQQAATLRKKAERLAKLLSELDRKLETIEKTIIDIQGIRLSLGDQEFYYLKEEHDERQSA